MPFCPKCKYEFVEGTAKCNTCDCDLVDELTEDNNDILEQEKFQNSEVLNEDMREECPTEDCDKNSFMRSAVTYQKLSDKYEDIRSSAYTLLVFGGAGIITMILEWRDIINIPISSSTEWLFNSVLGGIFIIFLVAGVISLMHAKQVKIDAEVEDKLIEEILDYAKNNLSKEMIDANNDTSQTMELLYFERADFIKEHLMHQFEEADEMLVTELTEQIYNDIFE